jgi:hypothetical protein
MRQVVSFLRRSTLALGASFLLSGSAVAGPPLLCHPFVTGGAESLPWGTSASWNSPDSGYATHRLVGDVVRLLDTTPSVLAHMETLRRATIYAARDARVAADLLAAVQARVDGRHAGDAGALALFDAGYLVETYRQASQVYRWDMLTGSAKAAWALRDEPSADGYALIRQALASVPDAEMELAASLMAPGAAADAHRRRAAAGAKPGSLLAQAIRAMAAER